MNIADARKIIAMLVSAYPNATFSKDTPAGYLMFLEPFPFEAVLEATKMACRDSPDFCPSAPAIALILTPKPSDDAETEWAEVEYLITARGYYRPPVFQDPITAEIIDDMNWQHLCMTDMDKLGIKRKQFIDTYRSFGARKQRQERLRILGTITPLELPL